MVPLNLPDVADTRSGLVEREPLLEVPGTKGDKHYVIYFAVHSFVSFFLSFDCLSYSIKYPL